MHNILLTLDVFEVCKSLLIKDISNKNNSNLSIKYKNVFFCCFFMLSYACVKKRVYDTVYEGSNIYGLYI